MEFTAQQIADLLDGSIEGDASVVVNTLSKIEEGKPQSLSFLANPQYNNYLYQTEASIVIVGRDFKPEQAVSPTLIRVDDAYGSFARLLEMYNSIKHSRTGIHPQAYVADSAEIGEEVYIGAGSVIEENVVIGRNTKIYHNVTVNSNSTIGKSCIIFNGVNIYEDTEIGNNVTLHAGAVLGADGFGFAPNQDGTPYNKVAQIGNVIIEDNVEIGANTAIDRATMGSTVIRKGVKLDNLIQVAHNVEIGENTVVAAQTGIAGSTKIGHHCMIAGQVGITGHLKIGDRVKIAAQSGIQNDVPDDSVVQGSPAFPVGDYRRSYVYFRKLPQLIKELQKLSKKQS